MEAGGKDCEEETLQSAFKKLRVDAESLPGAVCASDASTPRVASRPCLDTSGAKPKLSCPKDNWHGCTRKNSRGVSRTQRRRRSKSPILQPPKFTYCSTSTAAALAAPSGCLKQQRLALLEPGEPCSTVDGRTLSSLGASAHKELSSSGTQSHISPLIFGSSATYDTQVVAGAVCTLPLQEIPATAPTAVAEPSDDSSPQKSAYSRAESGASVSAEAADFRALSKLHSSSTAESLHPTCSCIQKKCSDSQEGQEQSHPGVQSQCQCQSQHVGWNDVEVYSFTGLRSVISECERTLLSHEDAPRTLSNHPPNIQPTTPTSPSSPSLLTSGSPRSCSEQARAYIDDITIDDLSGYMEYYLYIPKKMSHMAEMMYT